MTQPVESSRRLQAAATQEQLLAAARDVFEERGYNLTTVGAITTAAGTAHGTFYLYFRNKEDAFAQVVEEITRDLYQAGGTQVPGDPRASIESSIRGFLEVFIAHRGLWRSLLEASFANPAIEAMWLAKRRPFTLRVQRILEQQVASGVIRPLDAARTASSLGSMVEWEATTQFIINRAVVTEADVEASVQTLSDLWFHAVYVRQTPTPTP